MDSSDYDVCATSKSVDEVDHSYPRQTSEIHHGISDTNSRFTRKLPERKQSAITYGTRRDNTRHHGSCPSYGGSSSSRPAVDTHINNPARTIKQTFNRSLSTCSSNSSVSLASSGYWSEEQNDSPNQQTQVQHKLLHMVNAGKTLYTMPSGSLDQDGEYSADGSEQSDQETQSRDVTHSDHGARSIEERKLRRFLRQTFEKRPSLKDLCRMFSKMEKSTASANCIVQYSVEHQHYVGIEAAFFGGVLNNYPCTRDPTGSSNSISSRYNKKFSHYTHWEARLPRIHTYARQGDLSSVLRLLQSDPSLINHRDDYNHSNVLYMAVVSGSLDLVKKLISMGGDERCVLKNGDSLVLRAAWLGHLDILKFLLDELDLDLRQQDENGWSLLDIAVYNCDKDMLEYLHINKKMDLNKQKALQIIIHSGTVEFLSWCISENFMQINSRIGSQGLTTLMVAVLADRVDMVEFLFDKGVDYRAPDKHDENVLHKLAYTGSKKMMKTLFSHLKQREALSSMCSLRNKSVCKDKVQLVKIFNNGMQYWYYMNIDREMIPEVRLLLADNNMQQIDLSRYGLVLCSGTGDPDLSRSRDQIIDRYNNKPSHQLEPDCTPLMLSMLHGHRDLCLQLLSETRSPSQGDCNNLTPAHVAAMYGWKDVLARLYQKGLSFDEKSGNSSTPKYLAKKYGRLECARFLCSVESRPIAETLCKLLRKYSRNLSRRALTSLLNSGVDVRTHITEQVCLLKADLQAMFYHLGTSTVAWPTTD